MLETCDEKHLKRKYSKSHKRLDTHSTDSDNDLHIR